MYDYKLSLLLVQSVLLFTNNSRQWESLLASAQINKYLQKQQKFNIINDIIDNEDMKTSPQIFVKNYLFQVTNGLD